MSAGSTGDGAGDGDRALSGMDEPISWRALSAAAFALTAVTLEFLGSLLGDSPSTAYPGWLVPVAWPTWLRVVWWAAAAGSVAFYGLELARLRGRRIWLLAMLAALPFAAFAIGIAASAPWATWH